MDSFVLAVLANSPAGWKTEYNSSSAYVDGFCDSRRQKVIGSNSD
jgi:hypothetical protein